MTLGPVLGKLVHKMHPHANHEEISQLQLQLRKRGCKAKTNQSRLLSFKQRHFNSPEQAVPLLQIKSTAVIEGLRATGIGGLADSVLPKPFFSVELNILLCQFQVSMAFLYC